MKNRNDKENSEVYILGANSVEEKKGLSKTAKWIIAGFVILAIAIISYFIINSQEKVPEYYFEPEQEINQNSASVVIRDTLTDSQTIQSKGAYTETQTDTINDVPLRLFFPRNASLSLQIGMPDIRDTTIVFATMAADIRKDNQEIVGDFVVNGRQLSRGIAKKGFCAIVDNTVTLGMNEDTPLLKQAISNKGHFFRQYPLVINSELIENKIKNKSIRRAIGVRNEEVLMVESLNNESFHDFSQALIDIGITDAIYLVGGNAYGWYLDSNNELKEFGKKQEDLPANVSYIVWRTK